MPILEWVAPATFSHGIAGKASVPYSAGYPATQSLQGTHSYISTIKVLIALGIYYNSEKIIYSLNYTSYFYIINYCKITLIYALK